MNYAILILVPTLLYYIEEKIQTQNRFCEKIAILFIAIFSSLRVNLGADYSTYFSSYNRLAIGNFTDDFDYGYILLSKLAVLFGLPFHGFLFLIGLINMIFLYMCLKQNLDKYRWLAIFSYLIYFDLFVYSLSAIRQAIVMNICLYSIKFIYEKNFLKYFLLILLASSFHWTGYVLIPFYFIYNYLIKIDLKKIITIFIISLFGYSVFIRVLEFLRPYLGSRLEFYLFVEENDVVAANIYLAFGYLLISILWLLFLCKFNKKLYEENFSTNKNIINFATIPEIATGIFFLMKGMQNIVYFGALPRLQMYFYCFLPFAIVAIVKRFLPKERVPVIIVIIIILIIQFVLKLESNSQFYDKLHLINWL